jgi:hypothetical protein
METHALCDLPGTDTAVGGGFPTRAHRTACAAFHILLIIYLFLPDWASIMREMRHRCHAYTEKWQTSNSESSSAWPSSFRPSIEFTSQTIADQMRTTASLCVSEDGAISKPRHLNVTVVCPKINSNLFLGYRMTLFQLYNSSSTEWLQKTQ